MAIFSPLHTIVGDGDTLDRIVYVASMLIAAVVLLLNRQLPGAKWIAAGLSLNLAVIVLNGGMMPVWPAAREFAGMSPLTGRVSNVIPMTSETVLPFLGDVIPLPSWLPMANVMSIGDLLILCGGIIFTQRALFTAPTHSR